jgi:hypothetical protein
MFKELFEAIDTGSGGSEEEAIEEVIGQEEQEEEEGEVIEEIPTPEGEEKDEEEDKVNDKDDEESDEEKEQKKDNVIKKVLEQDKKFFKKFPELRTAYFENKQFKEHFTSVDDAKEAVENSKILQTVSASLQEGDPKQVIEYLKAEPKVLTEFGRNFIKGLDKEVFSNVMAPSIVEMLKEVQEAAKLHKNSDLENSVGWIAKYLFNEFDLSKLKLPDTKPTTKPNEEDNKLLTQIAKNFSEEVVDDVKAEMDSTIKTSLASLRNTKPAVIKTIINEIKDALDEAFKSDVAHNKLMEKLWRDAKTSNYSKAAKASIKSSYLAAVKKRLPEVRATVLKANGYQVTNKKKSDTTDKDGVKKFTRVAGNSSDTSSQDAKIVELKKQGKTEREVLDALIK